jgi:hypothetical protein
MSLVTGNLETGNGNDVRIWVLSDKVMGRWAGESTVQYTSIYSYSTAVNQGHKSLFIRYYVLWKFNGN